MASGLLEKLQRFDILFYLIKLHYLFDHALLHPSAIEKMIKDNLLSICNFVQVRNYFVAVGMNGNPLQGAGGIGRAVAEWIIAGEPTQDLLSFDVQRFLDLHNNRQYLQERIKEIVGRYCAVLESTSLIEIFSYWLLIAILQEVFDFLSEADRL